MGKKIESIFQLEDIKPNDILIDRSAGKAERFLIQRMDDYIVKVCNLDNADSFKTFTPYYLLSGNWWIENENTALS